MQTAREMPGSLPDRPMLHALAKCWWLLLLRGIAAIVFGVLAFIWPGLTLVTLVLLYGAFALVDGVLSLVAAFTGSTKGPNLVARRGRPPGHRCWCCDISVARHNRDPAGIVYRCLGIGTWHLRDYRRDPTAEGDRQRMDADPRRRALGNFRRDYSHCPGDRRARPGLGHRRLFNRVWHLIRRTRPAIAEAQPRCRISRGGVMTESRRMVSRPRMRADQTIAAGKCRPKINDVQA